MRHVEADLLDLRRQGWHKELHATDFQSAAESPLNTAPPFFTANAVAGVRGCLGALFSGQLGLACAYLAVFWLAACRFVRLLEHFRALPSAPRSHIYTRGVTWGCVLRQGIFAVQGQGHSFLGRCHCGLWRRCGAVQLAALLIRLPSSGGFR
jgi:hypothetical protein